jgi:DNA topoisomerase-1
VLLENIDSSFNIKKYKSEIDAQVTLDKITGNFEFLEQQTKETKIKKPTPLDMASFLMKMYSKNRYSNSKASVVGQKLYEKGLITYPRTDSKRISSKSFLSSIENYVKSNYGDSSFNLPFMKSSNSQDAHEAIRPTNIGLHPLESGLKGELLKGYELV